MPTFNHVAAKADVIRYCGSVAKAARDMQPEMDRTLLSRILNGERPGTVDLAINLSAVTGQNPYRYFGPDDPRAAVIDLVVRMGITPGEIEAAMAGAA